MVTKYSARIFSLALIVVAALLTSGLTQPSDQSKHTVETSQSSRSTFQVEEISPGQGFSFVLGGTVGVAYFTSETEGLRLVATVKSANGIPLRFVATLAANQTVTIALPREVGQDAIEVNFLRRGERVVVKTPSRNLTDALQ
jgi:hypothetical protein